ncbi:MAG: GEVED domain-containing protein [Candidatus Thermoplasmatota archaeon]
MLNEMLGRKKMGADSSTSEKSIEDKVLSLTVVVLLIMGGFTVMITTTDWISGTSLKSNEYSEVDGGDTSYGEYITNVQINGIDRDSGNDGGYADHTESVSDPVEPDQTYELSVTMSTNGYPDYATAVIDWDQDHDLSNDEVIEVGDGDEDPLTVTTYITVPEDAVEGETLMRVMLRYDEYHYDPCQDQPYGETEDYTVTIGEDDGGGDGGGGEYSEIDGGDTSYGEYITNVRLNGIDVDSGDDDGYADHTSSVSDPIEPGRTYELSVTMSTGGYSDYAAAVIDWDQDHDLSNDEVIEVGSGDEDPLTVTDYITVPEDAAEGETLMRVMQRYEQYHNDPGEDQPYGETEDYTVTIGEDDSYDLYDHLDYVLKGDDAENETGDDLLVEDNAGSPGTSSTDDSSEKGTASLTNTENYAVEYSWSDDWNYDYSNVSIFSGWVEDTTLDVSLPEGGISFDPEVQLYAEYDSENGDITEAHGKAVGEVSAFTDIRIEASQTIDSHSYEETIHSFSSKYYVKPLPVPPYLVWVEVEPSVVAGYSVSTSVGGTIETGLETEAEVTMGTQYEKGDGFSPIFESSHDTSSRGMDWEFSGGSVFAEGYVMLRTNVNLYSFTGPSLEAGPTVSFAGSIDNEGYEWTLDAGAKARASLNLRIFGESYSSGTSLGEWTAQVAEGSGEFGDPEFALQDWSVDPDTVGSGETVTIEGKVKNVGEQGGSDYVDLYVNDMDEYAAYEEVNLDPGESTTVSFEYDGTVETGTYDVKVELYDHDGEWSGQFEVGEEEPSGLVLRNWSVDPEAAESGETVTIEGRIENLGDEQMDDYVDLYVNDMDEYEAYEKVVLSPGESTTVSFEYDGTVETGTYDVKVELYDHDGEWSGQFEVKEE